MATTTAAHAMATSQLECSACNIVFEDPRMLLCGHLLCLKCHQNIASTSVTHKTDASRNEIQSALRATNVSISDDAMQDLPTNLAISASVLQGDGDEHGTMEHVCVDCWCETVSLLQLKEMQTSMTNRLDDIERRMMQQSCLTEINTQEKAGNSDAPLTEDVSLHPKCKLAQFNSKILQIDERLSKLEETNNRCTPNGNNLLTVIDKKLEDLADRLLPVVDTKIEDLSGRLLPVVDTKVEHLSDRLLKEISFIKYDNG